MIISLEEAHRLGHKCHKCRSNVKKSRKPKKTNLIHRKLYFMPKQLLNFKQPNKRIKYGTEIFRNLTCKKCDRTFRDSIGLNVHIYELHNLDKLKLKRNTHLDDKVMIEIDSSENSDDESTTLVVDYDDNISKKASYNYNMELNSIIEIDETLDFAIENDKNENIFNKVGHTDVKKISLLTKNDASDLNEYDTVIIEDDSKDIEVIEIDLDDSEKSDAMTIKRNFVQKIKDIPLNFNFKSTSDVNDYDVNNKSLEITDDSLNIVIEDISVITSIDLTEDYIEL